MTSLCVEPGCLSLCQLRDVVRKPVKLSLPPTCYSAINYGAAQVARAVKSGEVLYGVNTGLGLLANTQIATEEMEALQHGLVLSHSAGVGEPLSDSTVRLMMVLKINALARGYSGVRRELIDHLIALVNAEIYPVVPSQGSVGASGDLAPLAHMVLPMLGRGEVRHQGEIIPATEGLARIGLAPLTLAPKEGLALVNGTQASTAMALEALFLAEDLWAGAVVIGSASLEAALGSRLPFDERLHRVRGLTGQIDTARVFRRILGPSSELYKSHRGSERVQDPYSLRCQPQVLGACLTQIRYVAEVLLAEANGVTDNPLLFATDDGADFISGGNFHGEPVAMAADNLALAISEIGALAERRVALLIDHNLSGLPAFLVENCGLNSGFMIAQVTAAALASENKGLAHPACVDSLPTSANQEDHVSMAAYAARRLFAMTNNTRGILAIEWLAACQGLDFRAPLKACHSVESARATLRAKVPFYDKDRQFSADIDSASLLLAEAVLNPLVGDDVLPSVSS